MSVETNIAVLEQKIHTTDTVLERLADSFAKISEVSNSLTKILAIHDERFINQAKYNTETDRTIEAIVRENKESQNELFVRLDTNEKNIMAVVEDIRKDSRERHDEVVKAAALREKEQNDRITALERWRYTSMGMISVISTMVGYLMPSVIKFFGH
jgi:chromosome segregation ATPase